MAKLRSVSTSFWSDTWIEELTPSEKLIFLYLITNDKTNMLGIYEASISKISFETGVNKEMVRKALEGFESVNKVRYVSGKYVILSNYLKHQNYNTNMKKSAIDVHNNLPKELKCNGVNLDKSNPSKAFETLSNHNGILSKVEVEYEVEEEIEVKDEIEIRKERFKESLTPFLFSHNYSKQMLDEFFDYWSEHGVRDKKMRFEKEKSYDLTKRLARWSKNSYSKPSVVNSDSLLND